MIRPALRAVAVCLALVGQFAGAFGVPAVRGGPSAPDAACGCCPADRTAGRCCCHPQPVAPCCAPTAKDVDEPPCCHAKKPPAPSVVWVIPTLRSKCQGPRDMLPESVVPTSVPPEPPSHWTRDLDDAGRALTAGFAFTSRSAAPDDPPPRVA